MIQQRVLAYLQRYPNSTATKIAKDLGQKSATVSSLLYRLCRAGTVLREPGGGPRGGWIYRLPPETKKKIRCAKTIPGRYSEVLKCRILS